MNKDRNASRKKAPINASNNFLVENNSFINMLDTIKRSINLNAFILENFKNQQTLKQKKVTK